MGAFGDIGTRDLLFDAQKLTCPRAIGSFVLRRGLWDLGCRGLRLGRPASSSSPRTGAEKQPEGERPTIADKWLANEAGTITCEFVSL